MNFRFLKTGLNTAALNMAIDEAVLEHVADGKSPPTLRLYGWNPAAISIGYFQSMEEEVDQDACRLLNVDTVRRITGGGAVLHEHELTYSIHIPESLGIVPQGILESYEKISTGVITGLAALGVQAKFVPLNDLIVFDGNGAPRKISGNAQTRKNGVILQHGTILLKVDVEKMFSLLRVPDEKMKGKLIADIKQRVWSLSDALKREVPFEESVSAVLDGFKKTFSEAAFEHGALRESEETRAASLAAEKYGTDNWNMLR